MRAFKNRVMANNAEALASWRSDVAAAAHRHKLKDGTLMLQSHFNVSLSSSVLCPITAQAKTLAS